MEELTKKVPLRCVFCGKGYNSSLPSTIVVALECPNCERPGLVHMIDITELANSDQETQSYTLEEVNNAPE